jgi:hypothetical protein
MWLTSNWAVGGFALTSLSMYYWCDQRRKQEAKGMAAAMIGMKMLQEKQAKEKAEAEAATLRIQEEEKLKKKQSWWPW